jgi:hypothetical protein
MDPHWWMGPSFIDWPSRPKVSSGTSCVRRMVPFGLRSIRAFGVSRAFRIRVHLLLESVWIHDSRTRGNSCPDPLLSSGTSRNERVHMARVKAIVVVMVGGLAVGTIMGVHAVART